MFLTREILEKHEACKEGMAWFSRWFPDGTELINVINQRHVPFDFLDWGFMHLSTSDEEKKRYFEVIKVTNSTSVVGSHNINESNMVADSDKVDHSAYVYYSKDVQDSADIRGSDRIERSQHIDHGSSVLDSIDVLRSSYTKESFNISHGSYIINCENIFDCALMTNCRYCLFCKNLSDSAFCAHCNDCNHCLFCTDLTGAEYCIFNKPVQKVQWEFIFSELKERFAEKNMFLFNHCDIEDVNGTMAANNNYMKMFEPLFDSKEYVSWVKNLPYYDEMIAYKITYNPHFLMDK